MAERQASTLESVIHGCHIYKQIWRPLVGEILTLEQEEDNNHDKFAVSLLKNATCTVLGHVPREFSRVFWHFSGMERPSLVKLSIKESMVKVLPALVLFVLHTTCFARSSSVLAHSSIDLLALALDLGIVYCALISN